MSEETPNLGGGRPDPPPPAPMPMMFAGFALAFQLATVIVLVADRCGIATMLGVVALVFTAGTFFLLLGSGRGGRTTPPSAEGKTTTTTTTGTRPAGPDDRGPYDPTRR